jgi:hypothetical protein
MRELGLVFAGVTVGLAWIVIWAALLHVLGISPLLRRQTEDIAAQRERLRRIGLAKYTVVFGGWGAGVGFSAMTVSMDILSHERQLRWVLVLTKFLVLAVLLGSFLGYRNWRRVFFDPAPYPAKCSPEK